MLGGWKRVLNGEGRQRTKAIEIVDKVWTDRARWYGGNFGTVWRSKEVILPSVLRMIVYEAKQNSSRRNWISPLLMRGEKYHTRWVDGDIR
jgi:hypothetical protein